MKIQWDVVLTTLDGVELKEVVVGADGRIANDAAGNAMLKPVTLKSVAIDALLRQHKDEQSLAESIKLTRWDLANRIYKSSDAEFSITEIAEVKRLIGRTQGVMVFGRVCESLDPKS